MTRPALFLDRDGVINVDTGYVHRIDAVRFLDGIFDLARRARSSGLARVVVTNQAGIAHGYFTEPDFARLMAWMRGRFAAAGAPLDGVYYCPHHPEGRGAYRRACPRRKPAPGMLLQARDELDLDLARSVLVGDQERDIAAGRTAGVGTTVLLRAGADPAASDADAVVARLCDVARFLGPG